MWQMADVRQSDQFAARKGGAQHGGIRDGENLVLLTPKQK